MRKIIKELWILRDKAHELFKKLVLLRLDLAQGMDLVLKAHFPALVKKLEKLLDFWL